MAGNTSVENIINKIQDCSLRVTLQMLYILINEPGVYDLREISEKIGYNLQPAIAAFLDQGVFNFYVGNTKVTLDNVGDILSIDSKEKLTVVTRMDLKDQSGFMLFNSLMKDYENAFSKRKNFEEIVAFNSYMVADSDKKFRVDQDIIQLLSDATTAEYEVILGGTRFYPIAVYKNRQYDREYFVTLEKEGRKTLVRFIPYESSRKAVASSSKYVKISEVYKDLNAVEKAKEKLKYIWAPNDFYLDEKPFKVSAVIYDKSCIGKIKHDISNYKYNLRENSDETYSLKLKVLGFEVFRTWVLSYGRSIEIKEPVNLRENIIETLEKIRASYSSPKK